MLDENQTAGTRPDEATESDSNPILEIFGAAPLVEGETHPVPAQDAPAHDAPRDDGLRQELDGRLATLEQALESLQRQASFLPPKLRGLGERVDALATVIGDGRCRALLVELCSLDDLVRAGITAGQHGDLAGATRLLGAVGAALGALLENHGLSPIDTSGEFDPKRHQAVRVLPVDDPAFHGTILEVDRRGFAVDERVLRFAEVALGHHEPDADDGPDAPADPHTTPDPDDSGADADDPA